MNRFAVALGAVTLLLVAGCGNEQPIAAPSTTTVTVSPSESTTTETETTTKTTTVDTEETTDTTSDTADASTATPPPARIVTLGGIASCSGPEINQSDTSTFHDPEGRQIVAYNPGGLVGFGMNKVSTTHFEGVVAIFDPPINFDIPSQGREVLYNNARLTDEQVGSNATQGYVFYFIGSINPVRYILCSHPYTVSNKR